MDKILEELHRKHIYFKFRYLPFNGMKQHCVKHLWTFSKIPLQQWIIMFCLCTYQGNMSIVFLLCNDALEEARLW